MSQTRWRKNYDIKEGKAYRFKDNTTQYAMIARKDKKQMKLNELSSIAKHVKRALEHLNPDKMAEVQVAGKAHKWLTVKGFNQNFNVERWEENIEQYANAFDNHRGEVFYQTRVLFRLKPRAGGKSKNNMCLYNCLYPLLGENLGTKSSFKKFVCEVGFYDPVPFDKIPEICTKHKIQIQVEGDIQKVYGVEYNTIIKLKFEDGHYTPVVLKDRVMPKFQLSERLPLLMYDETHYTTDGEAMQEYESIEQLRKLTDEYHISTMFKNSSLLECYKQYTEEMDELVCHKIDLYSNKCSIRQTIRELVKGHTARLRLKYDHVGKIESSFIDACYNGGMLYCEKGTHQNVYSYDYVSKYPAILNGAYFKFPVREGTYKKLDKLPPHSLQYGIYRVIIKSNHKDISKIFMFSSDNTYTHFDVSFAQFLKKRGYIESVELIQDDQPNALIYSEDKLIYSRSVFGGLIRRLFDLKSQGIGGRTTKLLLSTLGGVMSERVHKSRIAKLGEDIDETNEWYEHNVKTLNENTFELELRTEKQAFRYPFGRLMPFMVAKARNDIAKVALNDLENVVFIQTDGVGFKRKQEFKTGDKLGDLKRDDKKTGALEIRHMNHIKKLKDV